MFMFMYVCVFLLAKAEEILNWLLRYKFLMDFCK